MNFRKIALALSLSLVAASSCIREDMSDCFSTNFLILSYKGDGTTEMFNEKVCRVEMFIFNSENRLVYSGILPDGHVAERKTQLPPLDAGDYRVVCVGNTHHTEYRNIPVKSAYSDMMFADRDYFAGNTVTGNDSLYFASIPYTVETFDAREDDQVKVIEFKASHYDVVVEVAGVPDPGKPSLLPRIEMCSLAPCTDFENNACGGTVDYIPSAQYDSGKSMLRAGFNIMRHTRHEDVEVCVRTAEGGTAARVNLAGFLAANPGVDCTRQEVLIPIRIEFLSGSVSITVPEWYIQDVKPEF